MKLVLFIVKLAFLSFAKQSFGADVRNLYAYKGNTLRCWGVLQSASGSEACGPTVLESRPLLEAGVCSAPVGCLPRDASLPSGLSLRSDSLPSAQQAWGV